MDTRHLRGLMILLLLIVVLSVLSIQQISFPPMENLRHYLPDFPGKITLSVQSDGRLGNQMFEFASLVGIGLSNNISVVIPPGFSNLKRVFNMTECQFPMMSKDEVGRYYKLNIPNSMGYDARVKDIRQHINHSKTLFKGFLQSYKYFHEHEDFIRRCYQFTRSYKDNTNKIMRTQIPKNRITVGIHVRRGDYLLKKLQLRGLSVAKVSYFYKAMDLMLKKYPNAFFIVASNDMQWAKANLGSRANMMSPFTQPGDDLALLANCQHSIISSGTFSWWAGWLANGTTIYYEDYPMKGSSLSEGLNRSEYYYKDWIPLGD
ncbi:hypothetical protein CAPTEDRAFT_203292 [Capitella teleta]|uniref:L-Fucosyltransferase n=1 Tax=Capitella teleta TaxID=283909 RepID=R7U156_CAPTE|nr:hypothetical protein CAPTEDRAFT_203292 [Capitella teleta]|eukprot:ELT96920.1 hypothetical protein CAPTEDRAFT_203292 [Capitella teleta]